MRDALTVLVRAALTAALVCSVAVTPAAAAAERRFQDCRRSQATPALLRDEPVFADRWVEVQGLADEIEVAFRASPARRDYLGMAFDNDRERVRVYVRNHRHDAAVRHCARQLGINKYVAIVKHRWSKGQLLGAINKTIDAVPELYDAGLFEGSYGAADRFNLEVYQEATDEQTEQIRQAAKATGVAFKLERLTVSKPVPVDQ